MFYTRDSIQQQYVIRESRYYVSFFYSRCITRYKFKYRKQQQLYLNLDFQSNYLLITLFKIHCLTTVKSTLKYCILSFSFLLSFFDSLLLLDENDDFRRNILLKKFGIVLQRQCSYRLKSLVCYRRFDLSSVELWGIILVRKVRSNTLGEWLVRWWWLECLGWVVIPKWVVDCRFGSCEFGRDVCGEEEVENLTNGGGEGSGSCCFSSTAICINK